MSASAADSPQAVLIQIRLNATPSSSERWMDGRTCMVLSLSGEVGRVSCGVQPGETLAA